MSQNDLNTVAQAVTQNVNDLLTNLAKLSELNPSDQQRLSDLSRRPVGLRDTNMFDIAINMPNREEIKQLRREMTDAICAEKWVDGVVFAFQALSMLGAI
jgi:hypothetical protein